MTTLFLKRRRAVSALTIFLMSSGTQAIANTEQPDALTIERIIVHGQIQQDPDSVERTLVSSVAPDVRDQIAREPGFEINSNGVVTGVLQHRGLIGDRIHVSHQGASIYGAGPNAMDSPLSHVIAAQHPKVTLYNGIAPVSAGYESIGGVVRFDEPDWSLTESSAWQMAGNASADYTDNGERKQLSAFNEWVNNHVGLRVAAQYQQGDDYQDGDGLSIIPSSYERAMGSIAGIWRDQAHEITYSFGYNNTNDSGTPALAMDIEFIHALWYRTKYAYRTDDYQIEISGFGNNNRHDMSNFVLRERMPAMARRNSVSSDVWGVSAKYAAQWKTAQQQYQFLTGSTYTSRLHESDISNPNNEMFAITNFNHVKRELLTVFTELQWQNTQGAFATVGVRPTRVEADADDVGTSMAMMNPNAAALVNAFNQAERAQTHTWLDVTAQAGIEFAKYWRFAATAAQKGRAPSYNELYTWFPLGISAGLADGRNYLGNLDLREEKAHQMDLSLQFANTQFSVEPRIFYYSIDDYITGLPSDNPAARMIAMMMGAEVSLQWQNVDAKLYGFDLAATYRVNDKWSLEGAFESVTGVNKQLDQPLYRIAPNRLDLRANYRADNHYAFVEGIWVDAQDDVSTLQNETRTPSYAVLNVGAGITFAANWQLNLLVKNLLDKSYVSHLGGVNRVNSTTLAVGERIPEMGRSINLAINYHW